MLLTGICAVAWRMAYLTGPPSSILSEHACGVASDYGNTLVKGAVFLCLQLILSCLGIEVGTVNEALGKALGEDAANRREAFFELNFCVLLLQAI